MTATAPRFAADAVVFDAYGTLFDVHSVAATAERLVPGRGAELSQLWRTKQLEYTWLQSLMGSAAREDFAAVTAHALDYALEALDAPLTDRDRNALCAGYLTLDPYDDGAAAPFAGLMVGTPRCGVRTHRRASPRPISADSAARRPYHRWR